MKHSRAHVVLLVLGTIVYLVVVAYAAHPPSVAMPRELLEIYAIKKIVVSTACYIAFASLVMGWALPRSQPDGPRDRGHKLDQGSGDKS